MTQTHAILVLAPFGFALAAIFAGYDRAVLPLFAMGCVMALCGGRKP